MMYLVYTLSRYVVHMMYLTICVHCFNIESRDFQRNKMREISRGKIERAQKDYGVAMEALEKMRGTKGRLSLTFP